MYTSLTMPDNNLSELDLGNNVELRELFCYRNHLTELDVSNNIFLDNLRCFNNNLSELDLSNNINLVQLHCYNNQLTKIDVSNSKLRELHCQNNKLRFSTVPIITTVPWFYSYSPQDTIYGGKKGYLDTVDLRNEFNINGNITTFAWFDITDGAEQEVTQPTNENGVFTFTSEYIDKRLRCKMTNAQFPNLTLVYEVEIKTVNIKETTEIYLTVSPNPAQTHLTIHHSKEIGNIGLYDLSGRLLRTYSGTGIITILDISDLDKGIYFLTIGGKTVKFIKE